MRILPRRELPWVGTAPAAVFFYNPLAAIQAATLTAEHNGELHLDFRSPAVPMRLWILLVFVPAAAFSGCKPPPNSGGAGASSSASSAATGASSLVGPGNVIPVGRIAVDVMEFGTPPRVAELGRRQFQARLKDKDQQWWQERDKNAKAGGKLPYDARVGLTPTEYEELENLKKQPNIRPKAAATIAISRKGADVYILDGGPSLPELTGVAIDLKNDQVRTPFGVTSKHSALTMHESSTLGAWSGIRWKFETPGATAETGTTVSLAVGRLASGRGILNYSVRKLTPPEEKKRVNVILFYDLPAAP